jgi:putative membrane protein
MGSHSFLRLLGRWVINALGVLLAAAIVPGISYASTTSLVVVVILLSFLNAFLKPLLVFFTLPFVIFTLGFGILFINAFLLMLAGWIVTGFEVQNFLSAFLGALLVSITSLFLSGALGVRVRTSGGNGGPPARRPRRGGGDVIDI